MGCGVSQPPKHRSPPVINTFEDFETPRPGEKPVVVVHPSYYYFPNDFEEILQGVGKLPKPTSGKPQVVLSSEAMPLVIAPLSFENGDSTSINLPIISLSRGLQARVCAICSLSILVKATSDNTEASVFFENIIRWTAGSRKSSLCACLLGIDNSNLAILQRNMTGFGFKVVTSDDTIPDKCHCILTKSSYPNIQIIINAIQQGVGVIICGNDPEPHLLNPILEQAGIPFANCTLKIGPTQSENVKVKEYKKVQKFTFKNIVEDLYMLLDNEEMDLSALDNIVTLLRYHIVTIYEDTENLLPDLLKKTWKYVIDNGCISDDNTLTPNLAHSILTVLIMDMIPKMPSTYFDGIDMSAVYPGKLGNHELSTFDIEITPKIGWVSTGLFLPGGIRAKISVESPIENLLIQVGSLVENTSTKITPWRRWPLSVLYYSILDKELEITSPFGGILYVLFDKTPNSFNIKFENVCEYPRYNTYKPETWEHTKDIGVPIAEIESPTVIFTLPTDKLNLITDKKQFTQFYHKTVQHIKLFTGCESTDPFRVIFDPDFNSDSKHPDYPIYLPYTAIKNLIPGEKPTKDIFNVIKCCSKLSLPEDYFSEEVCELFSLMATVHVITEMWPDSQPLVFTDNILPPNFQDLYGLYQNNDKELIPTAFYKVREYERAGMKPRKDMWPVFVQYLHEGAPFSAKILAVNSSASNSLYTFGYCSSSASLQHFQIPDNEIDTIQ